MHTGKGLNKQLHNSVHPAAKGHPKEEDQAVDPATCAHWRDKLELSLKRLEAKKEARYSRQCVWRAAGICSSLRAGRMRGCGRDKPGKVMDKVLSCTKFPKPEAINGQPSNAGGHRIVVGRPLAVCEIGKAILSSPLPTVEEGK